MEWGRVIPDVPPSMDSRLRGNDGFVVRERRYFASFFGIDRFIASTSCATVRGWAGRRK